MSWFPLYHGDYLRDTSDLSPSEHGIYLLLLMAFFGRGPLPDHITRLCRIAAGADPEEVRGILTRYWQRTPAGWINRRMELVISEQRAKHERRASAGKLGGQSKASNAKAMLKQCSSNQNQNQNQREEGDKPPQPPLGGTAAPKKPRTAKPRPDDVIPEGVDPQAWADFTAHRREIRKPLTQLSASKNAEVLRAMSPQQQRAAVNSTVANRWAGVFPPKGNGQAKAGKTVTVDAFREMVARGEI
jgi:uncharacterized protein YdaU (DUF1376 family)